MDATRQQIKEDFDRIALLASDDADNNNHYLNFLARHIPADCTDALEIGCGTGAFTRLLARRATNVLALDFAHNMLAVARVRSREFPQIDFKCVDVTAWDFPVARFDCIASIATLHHLPMREMLLQMRSALRPGGTLLVLDLFQMEGALDMLTGAMALPVNMGLRLLKTGRLHAPRAVRAAWDEHGRHDSYLTLSGIRRLCADILPAAEVRKHLLWRYSIIWKKPMTA